MPGYEAGRFGQRAFGANPDFVFPVARIVVFADGCFWHGCPQCGHVPRTNGSYWAAKLKRNRQRDLKTTDQLEGEGFQVLRFWEHELRDSLEACIATVEATVLRSVNAWGSCSRGRTEFLLIGRSGVCL